MVEMYAVEFAGGLVKRERWKMVGKNSEKICEN
jgi:hypothetical protein